MAGISIGPYTNCGATHSIYILGSMRPFLAAGTNLTGIGRLIGRLVDLFRPETIVQQLKVSVVEVDSTEAENCQRGPWPLANRR